VEAIDLTLADVGVPKHHAIDLANKQNEEGGAKSETSTRKGLGKGSNVQELLKHYSTYQADPVPQSDALARKIDKKTNNSIPLAKKEGKVHNIQEAMPSKNKVNSQKYNAITNNFEK
jgi:hypothetical protein